MVATFCHVGRDGQDGGFEERIGSALEDRGHAILGVFVTELAENDFPRLPVIQEPGLLMILSLQEGRTDDRDWKPALVEHPEISEILELEPTERSALGRISLAP